MQVKIKHLLLLKHVLRKNKINIIVTVFYVQNFIKFEIVIMMNKLNLV